MDWTPSISGGISGAFGLIGSALNYHFQNKLMDKQNQYNLNMWNLQNEYNSPSAQMRRYQEAGLNPALMYGQVTPGNATNAPHMDTPEAPQISRDLAELGKLFNIEGLKQAIADTKLKQANAKIAQTEARKISDEYDAQIALGNNYEFDPNSGMYVLNPGDRGLKDIDTASGRYYMLKYLADNFRTNSLLIPRRGLIGTTTELNRKRGAYTSQQLSYLIERQKLLAPQLRMLQYQSKYYPASFWIGTAAQGARAVSPFLPIIF